MYSELIGIPQNSTKNVEELFSKTLASFLCTKGKKNEAWTTIINTSAPWVLTKHFAHFKIPSGMPAKRKRIVCKCCCCRCYCCYTTYGVLLRFNRYIWANQLLLCGCVHNVYTHSTHMWKADDTTNFTESSFFKCSINKWVILVFIISYDFQRHYLWLLPPSKQRGRNSTDVDIKSK